MFCASYSIPGGEEYMFRTFKDIDSIKDALEALIEQRVTIILISGQRLTVEVDAVVDNLLVASIGNKILFIDIECICVVVTCCEEILESLLNRKRTIRRTEKGTKCRLRKKTFFESGSRRHGREEFTGHEKLSF